MRKSIENYVKKCDSCQNRKRTRKFLAPLGEVQELTFPFQITSVDITGPYPTTPKENKYLPTFIDHFTNYREAFPIPDPTAETCARVYATQFITRHGTGSKLITDQGRAFMSSFFRETYKILGILKTHTTSYHPESKDIIERVHRDLHAGLSHYVNSTNTNWDILVPFYLMSRRASPHSTTGFSPFILLHGREMILHSHDDLKARITAENLDHKHRLENLKTSLKTAYETVAKANRNSHQTNKNLLIIKLKHENLR